MHDAQTEPFGGAQPRKLSERLALSGPREPRLETDEIVSGALAIFFAQLHHGIGRLPGTRIAQTDRFEWAKTQHVVTPVGHLFDRQTSLKIARLLELLGRMPLQRSQVFDEPRVAFAIERNVQIIALSEPVERPLS